jgi:hypothetical protein
MIALFLIICGLLPVLYPIVAGWWLLADLIDHAE